MSENCPFCEGLGCTQLERCDEFYRQMQEAMLHNKNVVFITGGACPAWSNDCLKLQEYKAQQQKQR